MIPISGKAGPYFGDRILLIRVSFNWLSKAMCISLVLLYFVLWLVKKFGATFSTNQKLNQLWLCCTRFPALGAGYTYLLRFLIGSLGNLSLLWLARVITLVLVLRHSIENRSKTGKRTIKFKMTSYISSNRIKKCDITVAEWFCYT